MIQPLTAKEEDMTAPNSPSSIETIDCHYLEAHRAAAYLLNEGDRAAFIDNNTAHAVPHLMAALERRSIPPENVDYAVITHVHLDHAGGSAALLKACPNAVLLAHPKAARHAIEPSRLVQGAKAVYGETLFAKLYGTVEGVDPGRVHVVADGERLVWAGRELRFLHTLGHATHHICIHDMESNSIFTGDSFGLTRSALSRPGAPFQICTSSPTDFDAEEARKTARRIVETGADRAYVSHYGPVENMAAAEEQLVRSVDFSEAIMREGLESGLEKEALQSLCEARLREETETHLRYCGVADLEVDLRWLEGDIRINAQGLAYAVTRMRGRS